VTGSVAILTPAYGGMIHVQNAHSVASALFHLTTLGWQVGWIHYGNVASVTKARNAMVSEAITKGFTDMVFIDADIAFTPQAIERLLSHDLDLVAGVQKTNTGGAKGNNSASDNPFPYAMEIEGTTLKVNKSGLTKVNAVSTAFMRLRSKAVRELMDKVPELQYADDQVMGWEDNLYALFEHRLAPHPRLEGKMKYQGEDYSFCDLWRQHGGEVIADLQIPLRHIKTVNLDGHPLTSLVQERRDQT
jgi:hypothetical protein